jgi:hypothetical protein
VVGALEGLQGVTEGVPVMGASVGLTVEDPGGVAVGPAVVGALEGFPGGVTEGVPVMGAEPLCWTDSGRSWCHGGTCCGRSLGGISWCHRGGSSDGGHCYFFNRAKRSKT